MYTSIHAGFTTAVGIVTLLGGYSSISNAAWSINYPCWIITCYAAMMLLVLLPFGLYHCWLIATGRTTNEEVRGKYHQWRGNPFDRGSCISNFKIGCKSQPSMIMGTTNGKVDDARDSNEQEEFVQVYESRYPVLYRDVPKGGMFAMIDADVD